MKLHIMKSQKGMAALFGASIIYASFGILIRLSEPMFSDYSQTALRFAIAACILGIVSVCIKRTRTLHTKQKALAVLLGIAFGLLVLFFTQALTSEKIANVMFVFYGGSIVSAFLIGTFYLREQVTTQKVIAIILALFGIWMYAGAIVALSFGIVMGIVAGLMDGVTNTLRKALAGANKYEVMEYQFVSSAVFVGALMLFTGEPLVKEFDWLSLAALLVFAVLVIKLGDLLLYGFSKVDVNIGTVILSGELFFAALIGYFFFAETLVFQEILGGCAIFIASVIGSLEFEKKATNGN